MQRIRTPYPKHKATAQGGLRELGPHVNHARHDAHIGTEVTVQRQRTPKNEAKFDPGTTTLESTEQKACLNASVRNQRHTGNLTAKLRGDE
jgi:hypothetical protein